jgi:hypothetical protein
LIRLLDHIASQELTITEKTDENKRLVDEVQQLQSQLNSQVEVWETDKVWLPCSPIQQSSHFIDRPILNKQ